MTDDAALARELADRLEESANDAATRTPSPNRTRVIPSLQPEDAREIIRLLRTGAIWRAALSELVECKILKERAEQAYNESIRTDLDADLANNYHRLRLHLLKEYERRKAPAWDAAKIALDYREREGRYKDERFGNYIDDYL